MKVSINTVRKLVGFELPPIDEIVARINSQLGSVDEVIDLGKRYEDAVIVRVVSAEQHPDADRLHVCRVDDGGVTDIAHDDQGYVQVVCGAPNARTGMLAVWLPPGSTVPASFEEKEPFVLGSRELRGVMSHGMLAAGDELGINGDHDGIVEITEFDVPEGFVVEPGASFAHIFGLDDTIIDIENKMFTHRPDLFGQLGIARELFAILQADVPYDKYSETMFENEEWYWKVPEFDHAEDLELNVFNQAQEAVPRFMAVAMKNIKVKPSPLWLQAELLRWGGKSINNVVDLTNWIMLYTAQPTHAYDYKKLRGQTIGARMAATGEKVTLLNGKTYELAESDIVIADAEGAIGLAGIMGGGNSEVSDDTTEIVLEVANFDMYAVRKSSMRHGLFTDALTRFNKGQSPLQNDRVMFGLMEQMQNLAGANQASNVHDVNAQKTIGDKTTLCAELPLLVSFIGQRLGLPLTPEYIGNVLRLVNFATNPPEPANSRDELVTTPPFWRTDIQLPEDIVEEVGRLHGFHDLPHELPKRSLAPANPNDRLELKRNIRGQLARLGANELLTYSFVPEKLLSRAEQDVTQAFRLSNALSPDLQYYRLSVLPSLLDKVHANIKLGHDEFALFEIGKGHNKRYHLDDDNGLPAEMEFVDLVYASRRPKSGAAYYNARKILDSFAANLGLSIVYRPIPEVLDFPVTSPFNQSRSSLVETSEGIFIGMVGELKQSVRRGFKLPDYVSAITLDFEGLLKASQASLNAYKPLSRFPSVTQDISLKVPSEVNYSDVFSLAEQELAKAKLESMDVQVSPIDIYCSEQDNTKKTITLRICVTDNERTLNDSDVAELLDKLSATAQKILSAERT